MRVLSPTRDLWGITNYDSHWNTGGHSATIVKNTVDIEVGCHKTYLAGVSVFESLTTTHISYIGSVITCLYYFVRMRISGKLCEAKTVSPPRPH